MGKNPTIFGWYIYPGFSMGEIFSWPIYIYVRFNGGLSYTHLSPREGPRCAQLRGAVLAGHLSLFGVRNAAEEFGLRDSEAPWVRWMFCFSNVKDAGKKSMMFFFWLFGSMWIYDGSWCFFSFHEGFFFFWGGLNELERTFLLFGGVEGISFWIARLGCELVNSRRVFAVKNHHSRKNPKHSKVIVP